MKFLFIIQGEGRGHQTQAIALSQILQENGHQVCAALFGTSDLSKTPELFKTNVSFDLIPFESPALAYNPKTKGLSIRQTLKYSLPKLPKYINSIRLIKTTVELLKPDAIINFYDFLGGVYSGILNKNIPVYAVGHQYLLLNPKFNHPKKHYLDRLTVNINSTITAWGSTKKLALSFSAFDNYKNIKTTPPLLRKEIKKLVPSEQNFILVYLTQSSLLERLIPIAKAYPNEYFECFLNTWDVTLELPDNIKINPISADKYLEKMASCKAIITTAGFESACEAMYLNKPVMMIPVPNHYEQHCNAIDAQRAQAGHFEMEINVASFERFLYILKNKKHNHRPWLNQSTSFFLNELGINNLQSPKLEFA
jgi:uncharacterized protein (TIGR00661 family)